MKNIFPGHYRPTENKFRQLWDSCIFALDANVLLNLYRYSPTTRKEFLSIFGGISDRVWIPHQAALEYQENRLPVIRQQADAYDQMKKQLVKNEDDLKKLLKSSLQPGRHPDVAVEPVLKAVRDVFGRLEEQLEKNKKEQLDLLDSDDIRQAIDRLVEGRVGPAYSPERMGEIAKEGKIRYDRGIPPGYLDTEKGGVEQYGDLVMWFQLLDKARESNKSIILVNDEKKEDWWQVVKDQTIGPQPKLIEEMRREAEVSFYMYRADRFMQSMTDYLKRTVTSDAINEIRDIRKLDEKDTRSRKREPLGYFSGAYARALLEMAGQREPLGYFSDAFARALLEKAMRDEERNALISRMLNKPSTLERVHMLPKLESALLARAEADAAMESIMGEVEQMGSRLGLDVPSADWNMATRTLFVTIGGKPDDATIETFREKLIERLPKGTTLALRFPEM
ncbi:MAG: PIN-like domain-containing protein [Planctomycetota bacterium]